MRQKDSNIYPVLPKKKINSCLLKPSSFKQHVMRKITSSGENRLDGEHPKHPILLPDSDLCIWNIVGCEYRQKCE